MPRNNCPKCDESKDTRSEMCSSCRIKYNPARLGTGAEKRVSTNGYIVMMVDQKAVYEHRHKMEIFLGRKLNRLEHVHHMDEDRSNNDILNLELLSCREHHRLHMEKNKYSMSRLGHKARWGYEYASI